MWRIHPNIISKFPPEWHSDIKKHISGSSNAILGDHFDRLSETEASKRSYIVTVIKMYDNHILLMTSKTFQHARGVDPRQMIPNASKVDPRQMIPDASKVDVNRFPSKLYFDGKYEFATDRKGDLPFKYHDFRYGDGDSCFFNWSKRLTGPNFEAISCIDIKWVDLCSRFVQRRKYANIILRGQSNFSVARDTQSGRFIRVT